MTIDYRPAAAVLFAGLSLASHAGAEPCRGALPEYGVPIRVPLEPAALGMLPEACPATSLSLTGWGRILIAEEDFYGGLYAGGALRIRARLDDTWWVSAVLPGAEYRYVANATVEGSDLDTSAGAVGVHATLSVATTVSIAPFAKVLLPTETAYENARRWGVEHGVAATWRSIPSLEVVGGCHFPFLFVDGGGRGHAYQSIAGSVDTVYSPWRWVALGVGIGAAFRSGDEPGFEAMTPRGTLRLYPWRGAVVDLAAGFPSFGEDRTDVALGATLGWVL